MLSSKLNKNCTKKNQRAVAQVQILRKLIKNNVRYSRDLADVPQNAIKEHVGAALERLYRLRDTIADRLVPQRLLDSHVVR